MRAALPAIGTVLLLGVTCGAGYFVLTTPTPSFAVVDKTADNSSIGTQSTDAEATRLSPRARPDIYFAAITDRPVFEQSRRPIESAPVADEEPSVPESEPVVTPEPEGKIPEPNIVLLGVLTGGARNSALIALNGAEPEWVRQSAEVAGWILTTIESDAIELNEADRSLRIDLYRK